MKTLILSMLGFGLVLPAYGASAGTCAKDVDAHFRVSRSQQVEEVAGVSVSVQRLSTGYGVKDPNHPGVAVEDVFGADHQILIGVDRRNMRPYLMIGHTVVQQVSHRTEIKTIMMYNAALKVSTPTPVTHTIYQLGARKATTIPPGYFIHLSGVSPKTVREMESSLNVKTQFPVENGSWQGMIENLLIGLDRVSGISLACGGPSCDTLSALLSRSAQEGFASDDGAVRAEFYLVDEASLNDLYRRARTRTVAANVALGTLLGATGATAACIFYVLAASIWHLPHLPLPF